MSGSVLTDKEGKHFSRTESYFILRILERFGSPEELVRSFEQFYSLDEDWIAHLMAYEIIRQSEECLMTRGSL